MRVILARWRNVGLRNNRHVIGPTLDVGSRSEGPSIDREAIELLVVFADVVGEHAGGNGSCHRLSTEPRHLCISEVVLHNGTMLRSVGQWVIVDGVDVASRVRTAAEQVGVRGRAGGM
jgi:hypothetical protein